MNRPFEAPSETDLCATLVAQMGEREIVETAMATIRIEIHTVLPRGTRLGLRSTSMPAWQVKVSRRSYARCDPVVSMSPAYSAVGMAGRACMFNGHTDTVPPGTMRDPFKPRIVDGSLTGRGSCDMKGGLVAQLCAMIALKRAGTKLSGDLIFAGVIAEEDATNLGTLDVVQNGPQADMVVVAEPTNLEVAVAHKGFDYYRIEVDGNRGPFQPA